MSQTEHQIDSAYNMAVAGQPGLRERWVEHGNFNQIDNCHLMKEFFMNISGASDHWMFISSRGALSAGRRNSDSALFPYYSADKISDLSHLTGPKTIMRTIREPSNNGMRTTNSKSTSVQSWEPFSGHHNHRDHVTQRVYKSLMGNMVVFEETHHQLQLTFRYSWQFGSQLGFVRKCRIINLSDRLVQLDLLDGLENLVPSGLDSEFQMRFSNLADAYKKNELDFGRIGIFCLSSIPSDRAEPSEGLRSTAVWQTGLDRPTYLLSSNQVDRFRHEGAVDPEFEVYGQRGSFFAQSSFELKGKASQSWTIVADVNVDQCQLTSLKKMIALDNIEQAIDEDLLNDQAELKRFLSDSDGIQVGNLAATTARHASNAKFNIMRGGLPANQYQIHVSQFFDYLRHSSQSLHKEYEDAQSKFAVWISYEDLLQFAKDQQDLQLVRLVQQYLPFTYGRRHGDPSRPWNEFDIHVRDEDGNRKVHFQGNWRDIYQNWEALGFSFPGWLPNMICRFVNQSTADGYNPYRIHQNGFEWEEPVPNDPWANYGYWGDHQVIYLLRLVELARNTAPDCLQELLKLDCFSYANVPYRIKSYEQILADPFQTVDFDQSLSTTLKDCKSLHGNDCRLLQVDSRPYLVNLTEKLLVPLLAKLTNLVPDGGIWLNTQRPEWNDANNALVGRGLSVVTVCHLYRYVSYLSEWFQSLEESTIQISDEIVDWYHALNATIGAFLKNCDTTRATPESRKAFVDEVNQAGEQYRLNIYKQGFAGSRSDISFCELVQFLSNCRDLLNDTIKRNQRSDGLFHSYNLMVWKEKGISIEHLDEMLEGQVAVLSSGVLSLQETVSLLDQLRNSRMYREDVRSYLLYPEKQLAKFTEKNCLPAKTIQDLPFLQSLVSQRKPSIIHCGPDGDLHFASLFRNVSDLDQAIEISRNNGMAGKISDEEWGQLRQLFLDHFRHEKFIGRSATFFGYEGIGSVYWHMVSKLVLAIQERLIGAIEQDENPDLIAGLHQHYRNCRDGLGVRKSPQEYGAFPSDPYSHQPRHDVVQQPGMTGQVKEDLLSRFGELGLRLNKGCLSFDLDLLEFDEISNVNQRLEFVDANGEDRTISITEGEYGFLYCQVPIVYCGGEFDEVEIYYEDDSSVRVAGNQLDAKTTADLLSRQGNIQLIKFRSSLLDFD